jgi:hypothetical protein
VAVICEITFHRLGETPLGKDGIFELQVLCNVIPNVKTGLDLSYDYVVVIALMWCIPKWLEHNAGQARYAEENGGGKVLGRGKASRSEWGPRLEPLSSMRGGGGGI